MATVKKQLDPLVEETQEVTMPEVEMSEVEMPEVTMPEMTMTFEEEVKLHEESKLNIGSPTRAIEYEQPVYTGPNV